MATYRETTNQEKKWRDGCQSGKRHRDWCNWLVFVLCALVVSATHIAPASAQEEHPFDAPPCEAIGTIVTCFGDWSGGVKINNPGDGTLYDTLNLSATVPVSTTTRSAIDISTATDFSLTTAQADEFNISTTGADNHGIYFQNKTVNEAITLAISHYGNIITHGEDARGIEL